ncbi:hypothetical protein FGO68_gene11202 [Halteria grandinella]|uniref:Uncharacterized protein n=1 Tax=Halteria grandinella TaxID=5974 RepID=A0A8J8NY65_HALGN|nr:hypothetical protein FGO68_gene11202 [Halteria grandinella]
MRIRQQFQEVQGIINYLAPPTKLEEQVTQPITQSPHQRPAKSQLLQVQESIQEIVQPKKASDLSPKLRRFLPVLDLETLLSLDLAMKMGPNQVSILLYKSPSFEQQLVNQVYISNIAANLHHVLAFFSLMLEEYEATQIIQRVLGLVQQLFTWVQVQKMGIGRVLGREIGQFIAQMLIKHAQIAKTNNAVLAKIEETLLLMILGEDAIRQRSPQWIQACLEAIIKDSTFPQLSIHSDRLTVSRLTLLEHLFTKSLSFTKLFPELPSLQTDIISEKPLLPQSNLVELLNKEHQVLRNVCLFMGRCVEHKAYMIKLRASKCLKVLSEITKY